MVNSAKISVIIPCYNVEKYVSQCVDSIINQSIGKEQLEIILVDDCSTDDTVSVLKQYEQVFSDYILLILCEENGKQGTARNIGLQYATGDYISFVDADDWIYADMYKILLNLAEDTDSDIVQFRYTGDASDFENACFDNYKIYDFQNMSQKHRYLLNSSILNESCTTKLYKRALLERSGVQFAEKVCYEEPLFTYPLKYWVKKVCVLEAPLYFYRVNMGGTTVQTMSAASTIVEHLYVQQATYEFMRNTEFWEEYKEEIDLYFLHSFFVEPFLFMGMREQTLPVSLCRYMTGIVKTYIPDYKKNRYINDNALAQERKVLELLELTQDDEKTLADEIRDRTDNLLKNS